MNHIKQLLTSSDPATLVGSLALVVFLAIYAWRKVFPSSWLWIEKHLSFVETIENSSLSTFVWKAAQAIPGTLLGALVSAVMSGGDLQKTLLGALAGPVAAIGHELLRRYQGAVVGAASACLLLLASQTFNGCALFSKVNWPATVAHCAPSKATLVVEVSNILLNDSASEYVADMEKLAATETGEAVSCAIAEVLSQLNAPTAARTAKSADAIARGRAFLANHHVEIDPAL